MPYTNNAQLPKGVQSYLSQAAQEIYRDAYNYAWDTCRYTQDRHDSDDSRQVTANRVAWETVKRHCERNPRGKWVLSEAGQERTREAAYHSEVSQRDLKGADARQASR